MSKAIKQGAKWMAQMMFLGIYKRKLCDTKMEAEKLIKFWAKHKEDIVTDSKKAWNDLQNP